MVSRSESDVLELVRLVYAAGVNPAAWAPFLERYAAALGGSSVWFMFWNQRTKDSWVSAEVGVASDAGAMSDYNRYYRSRNPLIVRRTHYMRPGLINVSQARYPVEKFVRTEFYNDFCKRLDIGCAIGACILETNGICAHISCMRSLRAGLFRRSDVRFLRPLIPHIQRALQIHLRLKGLRLEQHAEASALDQLSVGVFLVSSDGRVLLANSSAQRLLAARDGLSVTSSGLVTSSASERKTLTTLIAEAARTARGEGMHPGGLLRVSRPSLRQSYSLLVAPTVPVMAYPALLPGCVTVLVRDPEETFGGGHLLAQQHGFTSTETKLAELLLQGQTLEVSGDLLAITRETAKTHLKSLLRKSRTNRQSEFVRSATRSLAGHLSGRDLQMKDDDTRAIRRAD